MAKEWAKSFYKSPEWRAMREYILKRDCYLCRGCGAPGTEVHHINKLTQQNISDKNISLNPNNLELLCDFCHKRKHDKDRFVQPGNGEGALSIRLDYEFDSDGNIVPPRGYA